MNLPLILLNLRPGYGNKKDQALWYKTFFMLNGAEHRISTAHKNEMMKYF